MTNSVKQSLRVLFAFMTLTVVVSCGDDETPSPNNPTISIPATSTVEAGQDVEISFDITTEGGYASSSLTATGGNATISSAPTSGATSGTITLVFSAGEAGSGSVDLTVTDNNANTETATAVVTIATELTEFSISSNITSNTTWETGKSYILETRIAVEAGATLTIQPGVIIKGQVGSGANATALLIARGAKIMAEGTSAAPIIFTTVADNIEAGQIASPNLSSTQSGLWGGLIVLGNAPISADAAAVQIEGIPPSDTNGLYGGTDAADNSGVIRYVSIRHGGTNIGEGNEINGLTLGGVGSGTTIEYVEIIGNQDDGIEAFGGTVNASNILVWNAGDDSFDMDQAYSGTIDNFIGILGADSDHGLELDGPEGSTDGSFTLQNGSIKGHADATGGEYADLRSDVKCTLNNIYFFNFKESSDFELDNNGVAQNYLDGEIVLTNLQFNVSHLNTGNLTIPDIIIEKTGDGETLLDVFTTVPLPANIAIATTPTVGADKSKFASWTWAAAAGELDEF